MLTSKHFHSLLSGAVLYANLRPEVLSGQLAPSALPPFEREEWRRYVRGGVVVAAKTSDGCTIVGTTPEAGTTSYPLRPELHAAWREFLSTVASGDAGKVPALRQQCLRWEAPKKGAPAFEFNNAALFVFDDAGRPQLAMFKAHEEVMLAMIGAELLAPGAAFTVKACERAGCPRFFIATAKKPRGRPQRYCSHPTCVSSTHRVQALRLRKQQERAKPRRHK